MRCLLVEDGNRLILIDTGIGNKQDAKFFGHYHLHGNNNMDDSLKKAGFQRDDITDVFLTHLHFDHCGGSIIRTADGKLVPAFSNATYYVFILVPDLRKHHGICMSMHKTQINIIRKFRSVPVG